MLGICSWRVERRISLKKRVLAGCHYHMAALHSKIRAATLIEAVRARRIALKMPLREFAAAIGRSIDAISAWENGHSVPRSSTRRLLVKWLGFDPETVSNSQAAKTCGNAPSPTALNGGRAGPVCSAGYL
jgi:DNA-binding transcriptional regulator YiaG